MPKEEFNQQKAQPQSFNQPAAKEDKSEKTLTKKQAARQAEIKEPKAPKVEVADLNTPNPENFKPKDPEAVVIAKSHPANPSTIATANVMRAQGKAAPDEDDAEVVDLASEKAADSKAA